MNNLTTLPTFRVVILTRDRPLLCEAALISALNQTVPATEVIVSDNSRSGAITKKITDRYTNVKYVRQSGALTAPEHMLAASMLVQDGYYNILHDDDELAANYIQEVIICISEYPGAVAIGTGYTQSELQKIRSSSGITRTSRYTVVTASDTLILGYTSPIYGGMPPFSSYTYNAKKVNWEEIRKYTSCHYYDTLFLASLLALGSIVVLNKPLFRLGVHGERISSTCGIRDYKIFYRTALSGAKSSQLCDSLEVYRLRSFINILINRDRFFRLTRKNVKVFRICLRVLWDNRIFRRSVVSHFKGKLRGIKTKGNLSEH